MRKLFLITTLLFVFVSKGNETNKLLSNNFEYFQTCFEAAIGIYEAGIAHHGDRERAIDLAVWFYDDCIVDEMQ